MSTGRQGFSQIILLGMIGVILLVGAGGFLVLRGKKMPSSEKAVQQEVSPLQNTEATGLGNLCSGEDECIYFCQNNRGRCGDYCYGKKIELCKKFFSSR